MNSTQCNNCRNLFSKWLFAAVLLLSFFTFSGLAVKQEPKFATQKTELIAANKSHLTKSITFNRALKQIPGNVISTAVFATPTISLLKTHTLRAKTQIVNCRRHNALFTGFFYQHKTIPNNNDEEPIALA